jgi:hypothetical protein
MQMTEGQIHRTAQALAETKGLLEKEMRYSPELRNNDVIAFYNRHIVVLTEAIQTGEAPPLARTFLDLSSNG